MRSWYHIEKDNPDKHKKFIWVVLFVKPGRSLLEFAEHLEVDSYVTFLWGEENNHDRNCFSGMYRNVPGNGLQRYRFGSLHIKDAWKLASNIH
jgi:hypothetical protein